RMEDASAIKRALFRHFTAVARRCGAEMLDGKPVPFGDRMQYALGNLVVYGPLRNVLGMSRIRVAYTAGAAIGPDLFRFSRSIAAAGYLHTGDAGIIDAAGHLRIIDRAKDVGKLAGGAMFAPNYIENKLKFFPHIKEVVAFGDRRDMVCAFVNIDMGSVGNWA